MGFDAAKYLFRSVRNREKNAEIEVKPDPDTSWIKKEEETESDLVSVKEEPEEKEEEQEEQKWYDSNTYACQLCGYQAGAFAVFSRHVEKVHNAQLKEFAASYSKTDVYYECQFCLEEIYHERSAIEEHVQNHFLTLKVSGEFM